MSFEGLSRIVKLPMSADLSESSLKEAVNLYEHEFENDRPLLLMVSRESEFYAQFICDKLYSFLGVIHIEGYDPETWFLVGHKGMIISTI